MYKYFFISLVFVLLLSCNNTKNDIKSKILDDTNNVESLNYILSYIGQHYYENFLNDSLRERKLKNAIGDGDTSAFISIFDDYLMGPFHKEFLFYSMIMAEKYDYSYAHYLVYIGLSKEFHGNLMELNNFYKKLGHYSMLKAWQKGNVGGKIEVKAIWGDNFDSLRALRYLDKLEKHLKDTKIEY